MKGFVFLIREVAVHVGAGRGGIPFVVGRGRGVAAILWQCQWLKSVCEMVLCRER